MIDLESYKKILNEELSSTDIPGQLGFQCWDTIRDICNKVNPKNILEIGFNKGSSALLWLIHSNASLISIDNAKNVPKKSIDTINKYFPNRFEHIQMDSKNIDKKTDWKDKFDLIFIDGDHRKKGVASDTRLSLHLNPKFICFDDYNHEHHRDHIQSVIAIFEEKLKLIKYYPTRNGQVLFSVIPEKDNHEKS